MQSANLSGPFRGCLYYALLGLPQATGLAGGYDLIGVSICYYQNSASEITNWRKSSNVLEVSVDEVKTLTENRTT